MESPGSFASGASLYPKKTRMNDKFSYSPTKKNTLILG